MRSLLLTVTLLYSHTMALSCQPNFNPFANTSGITDKSLEHDPLKKYYDLEVTNPKPIEQCWQVLFDLWKTAGFSVHLDLHTMGHHLCNPFSYLHPTFYDETDPSFTKDDADKLAAKMVEFHAAIGLSILVEPPPRTCEKPLPIAHSCRHALTS